ASRQIWNDWIAPNDLASRLRLEAARAMYGRGPAPQSILELIAVPFEASPFVPRPKFGIDGDRLASLSLQLLAASKLAGEDLGGIQPTGPDDTPPRCLVHQEIPPWYVTWSVVLGESGRLRDALLNLGEGTLAES